MRIQALLFGFVLLSAGCTKGVPGFETLDSSSVPQPMFSGNTTKIVLETSATNPITISGECDPKITGLVAVPVGLSSALSLAAMVTGGVTVACASTGTFTFDLTSLTAIGFTIVDNTNYEIQLRGVTNGGVSNPSTIRILYSTTGGAGPKRVLLTSGGTESNAVGERMAASASFKATVRLGYMANALTNMNEAPIKASTSYKFKSGAAAASN